jgi:hypothetical protein
VDVPPLTSTGTITANVGSALGTFQRLGGGPPSGGDFTTAGPAGSGAGQVFNSSSDPATSDDSAFQMATNSTASANNKTRGVRFTTNTTGFENIVVSWDQRNSRGAANTITLQYNLNFDSLNAGAGWVDAQTYVSSDVQWSNGRSYNFAGISGLNNNANAAFRLVATFATGTNAYAATDSTIAYNSAGIHTFDMITVSGDAITIVPLPPAALAGLSLMACLPLAKALKRRG